MIDIYFKLLFYYINNNKYYNKNTEFIKNNYYGEFILYDGMENYNDS